MRPRGLLRWLLRGEALRAPCHHAQDGAHRRGARRALCQRAAAYEREQGRASALSKNYMTPGTASPIRIGEGQLLRPNGTLSAKAARFVLS